MARNSLAGKSTGKSRSAKYYASHPEARKKKNDYDKKYHSSPARRKYRATLNAENRKRGTYGNLDGKDLSHTTTGRLVKESQSKNRARNRGRKVRRTKR